MAEQGLKEKTIKGIGWSALDNVAQFGVTFIVSIVLARLLTPDDYGLIGIIGIVTAICNALINGGFTNALIRKKDVTDTDYNTSFLTNFGVSTALYAIVYFASPLIAAFFKREELVPLLRVLSLGIIIGALALVQQTRLTKQVDFKTQTIITFIASLCSGVIGICMAYCGCGVWSLVAQSLSSQTIRTILLWCHNKWIPQLRFSSKSFHELFGFGWKIMLSQLLDTIWKESYQVIVGRFYSPGTLGQYTRSKQFSQLFSTNLTIVIQRVTFPVLSEVQDDKDKMIAGYRRIIKSTMFITAICMLFLGSVSEPLLYCLIGPQWHEAAVYLPLICVAGSLYPLHAINLNMLQVQGRSDLYLILEIIKKVIAVAPLVVGALVGIIPMLYVNVITGIIAFFLNSYYSGKFLGYSSWAQLKDIAPSYGIASIVAICVWPFKFISVSFWIVLPIQILVGFFVLMIVCNLFKPKEYIEVVDIMKTYFSKLHR